MANIDLSPLELACELIKRPSVTPEDAGCQQLMAEWLGQLDFACEAMPFADTENLWATRGQAEPVLVFAGHTDVVPAGPLQQWHSDPFVPEVRDGFLYGRGAADMKGSLAAMLCATRDFVKDHPTHRGSIAFLITSDEEGPFINGTVKVVETLMQRGQPITWSVVGEPSSTERLGDVIKNGRRGSLTGWIKIKGIQGHVAYPHLAKNAIHEALAALDELAKKTWDTGNEHFPPTSFQITRIHAGTAGNVVPGEMSAEFNFRYSTEQNADKLKSSVTQIFTKHGLDFSLEWKLNGEPFLTKSGPLLEATLKAIKAVNGVEATPQTSGGTSDGRFIAKTGAEVIELGPVNATIHQVNERVRVDDLPALSAMYYQILKNLLVKD